MCWSPEINIVSQIILKDRKTIRKVSISPNVISLSSGFILHSSYEAMFQVVKTPAIEPQKNNNPDMAVMETAIAELQKQG